MLLFLQELIHSFGAPGRAKAPAPTVTVLRKLRRPVLTPDFRARVPIGFFVRREYSSPTHSAANPTVRSTPFVRQLWLELKLEGREPPGRRSRSGRPTRGKNCPRMLLLGLAQKTLKRRLLTSPIILHFASGRMSRARKSQRSATRVAVISSSRSGRPRGAGDLSCISDTLSPRDISLEQELQGKLNLT
jgi:hypothetical protein